MFWDGHLAVGAPRERVTQASRDATSPLTAIVSCLDQGVGPCAQLRLFFAICRRLPLSSIFSNEVLVILLTRSKAFLVLLGRNVDEVVSNVEANRTRSTNAVKIVDTLVEWTRVDCPPSSEEDQLVEEGDDV